jgi:hypothetical protein
MERKGSPGQRSDEGVAEKYIDAGSLLLGQMLQKILHNQEHIMATLQELKDKVQELQDAVDADQAGDAQVVADLQAEIDRLKADLANGATPEQIAEVVASLESIKGDVSGPNA